MSSEVGTGTARPHIFFNAEPASRTRHEATCREAAANAASDLLEQKVYSLNCSITYHE